MNIVLVTVLLLLFLSHVINNVQVNRSNLFNNNFSLTSQTV